jgi:hypothetical protein
MVLKAQVVCNPNRVFWRFRGFAATARAALPILVCSAALWLPADVLGQATPAVAPGRQPAPLTCNPNVDSIHRGDVVDIVINSNDASLIYAFGSSFGTLVVKGNRATLNTVGVPDKVNEITVVCSAIDKAGKIVQTSTNVNLPPVMVAKPLIVEAAPVITTFQPSVVVAPSLQWTTGSTDQTISGGSLLLSDVKSTSYCDPDMRQIGLSANASDTSTTKLTGSTTNVDNNEVSVSATGAFFGKVDKEEEIERQKDPVARQYPPNKYANSYLGFSAGFVDNNLLGVGLQQTYTANYQYFIRRCRDNTPAVDKDGNPRPRVFASLGVGAGYMNQRLYATHARLNSAVLPLTAQVSYLQGSKTGIPPKFFAFALLGYMPVLNDLHAYQVGITSGVQIPTRIRWLTFSLSDTELYMNNAPTGFKRNYQNGTVSALITFPAPPAKQSNPLVPASALGACYGGDKLARLYCYDEVTADACAPPSMFRASQRCTSSGSGSILYQEQIRLKTLELQQKLDSDQKQKDEKQQ